MSEQQNLNSQTVKRDYKNSTSKYAILQETSGEENETWINFIKYEGNEDALSHLEKQLNQIDFYIVDDLSTFDIETQFLVSEQTAKEMTKVDLNHYSFHRKFDGTLKKIDLGLKEHYDNEKKMTKVFDALGYGKIEEYIDEEDIDPEDLNANSQESESESGSESEEDSESSSSSETEEKKHGKLPKVSKKIQELPRFAKAKAHRRHK
jgi:hypothetical protein